MNVLEQWAQGKREIEAALAEGQINPEVAARIKRRSRILKRRRDRKAWREAQAAKLRGDSGGYRP